MSDGSFWSRCGVVSIDHYAVTTRDLHSTTKDYLDIPGTHLLREPGYNKSQNVDFSFVRLATGETIEILGAKDNSPITEHVSNGGGSYHICFVVDDIDIAIKAAINEGAILVVEPREDDVFYPRRVCFMMHSNHGLFEFLESFPKTISLPKKEAIVAIKTKEIGSNNSKTYNKIVSKAFRNTFANIKNEDDMFNASYNELEGWDSLKHLILIMEVEKLSGTSFTAHEISKAKSFTKIVNILSTKIK